MSLSLNTKCSKSARMINWPAFLKILSLCWVPKKLEHQCFWFCKFWTSFIFALVCCVPIAEFLGSLNTLVCFFYFTLSNFDFVVGQFSVNCLFTDTSYLTTFFFLLYFVHYSMAVTIQHLQFLHLNSFKLPSFQTTGTSQSLCPLQTELNGEKFVPCYLFL